VTGLATLAGLEVRSLLARRGLWAAVVLAAVAAMLGAVAGLHADGGSSSQAVNGWRCLAYGMGPGILFASMAALLLGSQSISGEADDGSLRALLTRPVSRTAVLLGKAVALALAAVLLTAAAYLGAVLVGSLGAEFGDVVQYWDGLPVAGGGTAASVMWRRSLVLALCTPWTVLAAAWLGLLVSAVSDRGGASATAALFLGMPLALLSTQNWSWCRWLFPWPLGASWLQFERAAGAFSTRGWLEAPVAAAAWLPLVTAALLLAAALGWFRRRDVLA
jgi:ABC-type transport system involved in multi-copper enzyme maturation permease subunit